MCAAQFSRAGQAYIWAVIAAGLGIAAASAVVVGTGAIWAQWLLLAGLTAVSSSASVALIFVPASISVSDTFVFAALLLFGPAAGALTVAVDGLIVSCWMARARQEPQRLLFNIAAPTLSVWCASWMFYLSAGLPAHGIGSAPLATVCLPLALCTLGYFVINSGLIAAAVAFETRQLITDIWRQNFAWLSLNHAAAASLSLLLLAYTRRVTLQEVALLLPVLGIVYFAFRTAMGRMRDANQHLGQLNRLYLSTIEALAMAIDAKDQVTHGHIRRVQLRAVALARRVGVQGEAEIKAIEAAALLHDTGKIAIPEHILNKPGKLTPAEFETMKTHARIGADILSSIEFPFPVVPIVRHHHENWNGSGYPDGIRGVDIPIGARILAVVDCFDALTSHRPYRRAMSDEEAIAILQDRRGSMYDPLVVDTFVSAYKEIVAEGQEPAAAEATVPASMASAVSASSAPSAGANVPAGSSPAAADGVQSLIDFAAREAERLPLEDWGELLLSRLSRLTPADLAVLFLYDESADAIAARVTRGVHEGVIRGLKVPLGDRLSGWAAATRRSVPNGDPALDFCDTPAEAAFRSALIVPLVTDDALVGVLALYASAPDAFTTVHCQTVESLAGPIASATRRCAHGESIVYRFTPLRILRASA